MKKKILITILGGVILLGIFATESLCAVSPNLRIKIDGSDPWVNINVSESYEQCELLNMGNSTLGTSELQAHLTTDEDWSAMAIFAVTQYGGQTTNRPISTSGNKSGIMDFDKKELWQVAGVQGNTSSYVGGLYENGQPKRYVTEWPKVQGNTGFVGFTSTEGWFRSLKNWNTMAAYPLSIKQGLFGFALGYDINGDHTFASGVASSLVSFRPALWN